MLMLKKKKKNYMVKYKKRSAKPFLYTGHRHQLHFTMV